MELKLCIRLSLNSNIFFWIFALHGIDENGHCFKLITDSDPKLTNCEEIDYLKLKNYKLLLFEDRKTMDLAWLNFQE